MKKFVFVALLLTAATPVYADLRKELCTEVSSLAITIMTARQSGVPLDTMLQAADQNAPPLIEKLANAMILDAYKTPQYSSQSLQGTAIIDFATQVTVACYEARG